MKRHLEFWAYVIFILFIALAANHREKEIAKDAIREVLQEQPK